MPFKDYETMPDAHLVEAILQGDGEALVFLLTGRCGQTLAALCQRNRAARMEPADLAQAMALRLLANDGRALRSFRAYNAKNGRACQLSTYTITCATRLLLRASKKRVSEIDWTTALGDEEGHWREAPGRLRADMTANPWAEAPHNQAAAEQRRMNFLETILDAILALDSPAERLVLLEYKLQGRPPEEVARMLERQTGAKGSVDNVYKLCERALKKLRAALGIVVKEKGGRHV